MTRIFRPRSFLAILLPLLLLGGCGYQLAGAPEPSSPGDHSRQSIAVPVFENRTFEPLVERQTTDAIKEELLIQGWPLVNDPSQADLVITGKVVAFSLNPLSLDLESNILEYRVLLTLNLTLENTRLKQTIWKAAPWEGSAEFLASNDAGQQRVNEDRAIREASRRVALDLSHRLSALSLSPGPP